MLLHQDYLSLCNKLIDWSFNKMCVFIRQVGVTIQLCEEIISRLRMQEAEGANLKRAVRPNTVEKPQNTKSKKGGELKHPEPGTQTLQHRRHKDQKEDRAMYTHTHTHNQQQILTEDRERTDRKQRFHGHKKKKPQSKTENKSYKHE